MKFLQFIEQYKEYPIINSKDFNLEPNPAYLRRLVSEWLTKGLLLELKRGHYVINQDYYKKRLSLFYIANQLYAPSYISLESALSFYQLIPEGVYNQTSISTKKTTFFENSFGVFRYSNISTTFFSGFNFMRQGDNQILIANKEKAFLDYLYLNRFNYETGEDFIESMRLQNANFNRRKIFYYLKIFNNKKLSKLCSEVLDA